MRGILVALALLGLVGCVSDEEAMVQDHGFCNSIGAKGDTYAQCMMQRKYSRDTDKQNRREAYARFSQSIQQQQQQQQLINQMNRPRNTTCHRFGNQISCNTF